MTQDISQDIALLRCAYKKAYMNSTDPSTQNGAIILISNFPSDNHGIRCSGANHFPRGVKETGDRWERPIKYSYVEHAERNAIFKAARLGLPTEGATMYVPWFACADCARAIIQAGIVEVVGDARTNKMMPQDCRWKETIEIAYGMFDEAGVKYRHLDEDLGLDFQLRFGGKLWTP